MPNGALVCWIIAAVMLPGILLVLLVISLLLSPRSHPSQDTIRVSLDKLIRIGGARDGHVGKDAYRIKKRYEEFAEGTRNEDASRPLVMVG